MTEIRFGSYSPRIRFTRSSKGVLGGVCRGFADHFQMDKTLVRLLWLGSIFFFGFGFCTYLLFWISIPREDGLDRAFEPRLLGVCSRLSQKMKWEIGLVRAAAILIAVGSLGFAILAYFILYFSFEDSQT